MDLPVDFHAHHGAFGAYGSFTLGRFGAGGGFQLHDGRAPARGEVLVGFLRGDEAGFLPFSSPSPEDLSAFAAATGAGGGSFRLRDLGALRRELGWGVDAWRAGEVSFALATPFGPVADPRAAGWETVARDLLPAVRARIGLDNSRSGRPARLVLGLAPGDTGASPLDVPGAVACALQGRFGMASPADTGAEAFSGFSLLGCFRPDLTAKAPHWLGTCWGLSWTVPAGVRAEFDVALGWYHAGPATTGLATRYAYTTVWPDLESVLGATLETRESAWETASARDRELEHLPPERRWMLAHATRGYFGNSQLLADGDGNPVYVVNEGEYGMMNTLDLAVDHVFFEDRFFPWTTREILDLAAARHAFRDRVRAEDGAEGEGGLSFCHDMGVRNRFAAPGTSSYEDPDRDGCFSHMTFEQACNGALLSGHVARRDPSWARSRAGLLRDLLESLERREHPDPGRRDGVPSTDSDRCGSGREITTYDSLDPSLARASGNLYSTVKLWAAYRALALALAAAGDPEGSSRAEVASLRPASAVAAWPSRGDLLPAFREGCGSFVLPAVESLVHADFAGDSALRGGGAHGAMVERLRLHLEAALAAPCRFPDGGWRLSSTSDNSWLSKVWLAQSLREGPWGEYRDDRADRAHLAWLAPGSADWGFCDQIAGGRAIGSKSYPRGVTAILFLRASGEGEV